MGNRLTTQLTTSHNFQCKYVYYQIVVKNLKNTPGSVLQGVVGLVWKIEHKKTNKLYALKQISKAKVLIKKSVESVLNQLQLLKCLHHQFLINAVLACQDRQHLYLIMDHLPGGDLRYHLIKNVTFKEQQTKFFIACIVIGLEFLHNNGIIHRDIKPQNLVLDKKGYVRITDLGVAKIWKPQNSGQSSGTPGYMAPQVICRSNHGVCSDYYAVGVIAYQFMFGVRPYIGSTRYEIRDKILARQVQIKKQQLPSGWSSQALSFINKCLQRKPHSRIGYNGPQQLKNHSWFKDIDWCRLKNKQLNAPYIPIYDEEQYQAQLNNYKQISIPAQTNILLRKENLFEDYEYDGQVVKNPLLQQIID